MRKSHGRNSPQQPQGRCPDASDSRQRRRSRVWDTGNARRRQRSRSGDSGTSGTTCSSWDEQQQSHQGLKVAKIVARDALGGDVLAELDMPPEPNAWHVRQALRAAAGIAPGTSLRLMAAGAGQDVDGGSMAEVQDSDTISGGEVLVVRAQRLLLASADRHGAATLWDASTGEWCAELRGHPMGLLALSVSSDGSSIATASADRSVKVWNAATCQSRLRLMHARAVTAVAFSPDGLWLATASQSTARVWSTGSFGECVGVLLGHKADVVWVCFSVDSRLLVTASEDALAIVWDASLGKELARLRGHALAVNCASFSPAGGVVVTGSRDRSVRLWSGASSTWQASGEPLEHPAEVLAIAISHDGAQLAAACAHGPCLVWRVADRCRLATLGVRGGRMLAVAFSHDGQFLATGGEEGLIRVWGASSWQCCRTLSGDAGTITALAFAVPPPSAGDAAPRGTAANAWGT